MTKEQSLEITGYIGRQILLQKPPFFAPALAIQAFLDKIGLEKIAGRAYVQAVLAKSRCLSAGEFLRDPYLQQVTIQPKRQGQFLLTNEKYEAGELFLYDEPDLSADVVIPRLGVFDAPVLFPGIYEGDRPWMSICPSEINSMKRQIAACHGHVLVLGLGMGYYPAVCGLKDNVSHLTVVELQQGIIDLYRENIHPLLQAKDKITLVHADAYDFLRRVRPGQFDYCFADIWEGLEDGVEHYLRLRELEKTLPGTEFSYWIEPQIRDWLVYAYA